MITMEKPPFKLGITLGLLKGQKEFSTEIEHPPYALNQANDFIRENYDPNMKLILVDANRGQRRQTRRRL